jgi:hypothetical protein
MYREPTRPPSSRRGPAAPTADRRHRSTISLPPKLRSQLEARGARSDKSHGPYNYTRQLERTLRFFDDVISKSDPRNTSGLPQDRYDLILEVLTEPLSLESFHITRLGDYLAELRLFRDRARELALDCDELRNTINVLPFAEKLHLVQTAQVRHAPSRGR